MCSRTHTREQSSRGLHGSRQFLLTELAPNDSPSSLSRLQHWSHDASQSSSKYALGEGQVANTSELMPKLWPNPILHTVYSTTYSVQYILCNHFYSIVLVFFSIQEINIFNSFILTVNYTKIKTLDVNQTATFFCCLKKCCWSCFLFPQLVCGFFSISSISYVHCTVGE